MPKLLVIADDLTGAADTGAQFAGQGVPTFVLVEAEAAWPEAAACTQVLVVNTGSRHLRADEAAKRIASAAGRGAALGMTHYYKKTDSTLRGNIGAELEALRVATGQNVLPFLPAYPRLGRTTTGGAQYVCGKPLDQTSFADDPLEPITDSYVPALIGKQTRTLCRVVDAPGSATLNPDDLDEGIYVFDAATDEDFRRAGELLKNRRLLRATAGSAGFAEHLPRLLGLETLPQELPRSSAPILVAAGSLNQVTLAQLAHAEAHGFASIILPAEVLATDGGARSAEGHAAVEEALRHSRLGRDVIIRSVGESGEPGPYLERTRSSGVEPGEAYQLIAKNMGEVVAEVIRDGEIGALAVLGGDTLLAIARSLGWSGLVPRGEISPGVAVSEVMGRAGEPLVVSKAGGFGPADVLSQVKRALGGKI